MSISKTEKLQKRLPYAYGGSFPSRIFFIQPYQAQHSKKMKSDSFIAWHSCRNEKEGLITLTQTPRHIDNIISMLARDAAKMHFMGYEPLDLVIAVNNAFYHIDNLDTEHLRLIAEDQGVFKVKPDNDHNQPGL